MQQAPESSQSSEAAAQTAQRVKREMRVLRRFFYFSLLADFVAFAFIAVTSLVMFPSATGVFVLTAVAMPLLLWHQSWVDRRMRCPSCAERLGDLDGIALHARHCSHCAAVLR